MLAPNAEEDQILVSGCAVKASGKLPVPNNSGKQPTKLVSGRDVRTRLSHGRYGTTLNGSTRSKGGSTVTEQVRHSLSNMSISSKSKNSSMGGSKSNTSDEILSEEPMNESLRWDCPLDDSDEEEERIQTYKINRRKRYLAAANKDYVEWMKSCSSSGSITTSASGSGTNHEVVTTSRHCHSEPDMTGLASYGCQRQEVPALLVPHVARSSTQELLLNCR